MGAFNRIDQEIRTMFRMGHNITDVYIYFKDYVSHEDVIRIYEEETA